MAVNDACTPAPPRVPGQLERAEIEALAHDDVFTEAELVELDLSEQRASGVELREVRLTNVTVTGAELDMLKVADGEFASCDLSNLHGQAVKVSRVSIERSRLTGVALQGAALHDLGVRGCRVDLASFGFSKLARVTFEDCLMAETSFLEAELESVRFHGCDLARADFRGARLRRCEFRRCDLTELEGVQRLRGAAIDWPGIVAMADVWAAALGITVLDDPD
jgi:uncharacterized protein YjbI with pentapeptide repeats